MVPESRITLGDLFHLCASEFDTRPCIVMANTNESITYAELENRINRIAHGITKRFGDGGRYYAIMLENSIDYVAITYALKKTDNVEVSINRAFRGPVLHRTINLTGCETLFTSAAHFDAIGQIQDELIDLKYLVVLDGQALAANRFPGLQVIAFNDLLSACSTHIESMATDLDTAAIMFTSGTTGVSKGCVLSHRYAVTTARNMIQPFRITGSDVNYTPYPLSHIGPAYYDILPTFITGGKVVLRDGFSLSSFWPEVCRHGVTWFMCLGSVQQLLYAAPELPEEKQHKVTRCWSTPAPVPKEKFDKRFNLHLIPGGGYGSTDAGWVVAPQWSHPGGLVFPEFEIAIVDENDEQVSNGSDGELVVRPKLPGVMSDEYFGMPVETLESRRNQWFHTGDVARIGEDGYFYFRYRMAERIRVRGEMVSGFEVEEGALSHPDVEDAAAVGVPAELGEEEVRLFVTLKNGSQTTAEEIRLHCTQCMAKFMVPTLVTILDEMPRTPTGKPEKAKLKML